MEKNPAQEDAIRTIEGPVLLISCPGSGKTTTMIRRIKAMTDSGIAADSIVMVTFTEAAAMEMKVRFLKNYGESEVTFCTIHSLCLKIISSQDNQSLRIASPEDQYSLLREVLYQVRIPAKTALKDVLIDISAFKNGAKSLDDFCPACLNHSEFVSVYHAYENRKESAEFMDFDDLLRICKARLESDKALLHQCRQKYRYLMCDEYQDTNFIQKEILYLLAGKNGNLCVVGDDDQSIYGFRGANPRIMMDFKTDFPDVHEINMDTNYRSQPRIIEVARNLIEHNTERFEKNIKASRTGTGEVIYETFQNRKDEISYLCTKISELLSSGTPPTSIAVLTRMNQQLEDVAAELDRRSIPYTSNDAIKDIYDHFVFNDIIAYLRLINDVGKVGDLIRILNKPSRYLRERDFRHLQEFTEDAIIDAVRNGSPKYQSSFDACIKMFRDIISLRNLPLSEQVQGIAHEIGYQDYLGNHANKSDLNEDFLLGKLNFFLTDVKRFHSSDAWSAAASYHIRQHKANMQKKGDNSITISTMHKAKGLEWDYVFIIDCCQGYTPISKATTKEEVEEERRLFYVAITRAKESVFLFNYRQKPGKKKTTTAVKASIFISEMKNPKRMKGYDNQALAKKQLESAQKIATEFEEGDIKHFYVGMEVHHNNFGLGKVISKTLFFVNVQFSCGTKMFQIK